MSTKKTIQINPELFKFPGNRTKNKTQKIKLNPIVSPSILKNKLLKRIQEHKDTELKKSDSNKENKYTDEFYGAINYLSDLKQKQKQEKNLNTKTLKNQSIPNIISNSQILLDLPPEFDEPNSSQLVNNEVLNINYKTTDNIPYGCLKNGKKKTYREWKELTTSSNYQELSNIVRPPTPPKKTDGVFFTSLKDKNTITQTGIGTTIGTTIGTGIGTGIGTTIGTEKLNNVQAESREFRLEQIKNKLRKLEDKEISSKRQTIDAFNKMEKEINKPIEDKLLPNLKDFENNTNDLQDVEELFKERETQIAIQHPTKYLKKTTKRKFTLGKSVNLKRIGILIKDRQTRKNIINTQKELKKTDITDVKNYLRQHGLIRIGSTCPTDILRKTFECAVLTGEVTNTNKEILLHNFING